jgi:hypothetical protein
VNAVVDFTERTQDEHRGPVARGPQGTNDGQTVDARQHAIDDHDLMTSFHRQVQSLPALGGMVNRMTAFPETLDQVVCGVGIVLDDQNVHELRSSRNCARTGDNHCV